MLRYYPNESILSVPGYEIYFTRFADSIIDDHFREAVSDLEHILSSFYINEDSIIKGGGGKSQITQRLAALIDEKGWNKAKIESAHHVGDEILTSESHEVDHYKRFPKGNIGLEIEWNNKDPFYDRDLENFRKLHQIGDLSLGVLITRGQSLQDELLHVFERFLTGLYPFDVSTLMKHTSFSDGAKKALTPFLDLPKEECIRRVALYMHSSKFGQATTHMKKLLLRLDRGLGNPCPFILIGIGKERLKIG